MEIHTDPITQKKITTTVIFASILFSKFAHCFIQTRTKGATEISRHQILFLIICPNKERGNNDVIKS